MALTFMIVVSLIITIIVNVATSCWVCYGVAIDTEHHWRTIIGVTGIIIINAMVPFILGCITGLYAIM